MSQKNQPFGKLDKIGTYMVLKVSKQHNIKKYVK